MKITGTSGNITFDLENGYSVTTEGEMLTGNQFVVYMNSMKTWNIPHADLFLTCQDKTNIVEKVKKISNKNTVQIIFE